jgi:diaminopimelate epimerase
LFKEGTNVNFYHQVDESLVNMQTFERGAGLTLACGTGACATFAVLRKKQLVKDCITIKLPLGELVIREESNQIFMSGPSHKICDIEWE